MTEFFNSHEIKLTMNLDVSFGENYFRVRYAVITLVFIRGPLKHPIPKKKNIRLIKRKNIKKEKKCISTHVVKQSIYKTTTKSVFDLTK